MPPELKKTEMCLTKDGIRISINFDKGDEEASTGITVSPQQIAAARRTFLTCALSKAALSKAAI